MQCTITYNETDLLRLLKKEDETAFRLLYDRYRNKIFSIAYKLLKDEALAEDAVQEVFVKLWLHKEKLNEISNFNAYLNTITRNYLFNQLKKMAHAEKFVLLSENKQQLSGNSLLENIEAKELYGQLAKVVNTLPPQQKKVYQLGKVEGLKYEEIARELHVSKETVKTHMSEALRSIKRQLLSHEQIILRLMMPLSLIQIFFF